MGPTHKELKKNKNKSKTSNRKDGREKCSSRDSFDFFLCFLVFKYSFSDSRVFVRQNSSG